MATSSKSGATGNLTSDATFRAYHKDVSDTIKDAGASLTSDTGQINFTTVSQPANGAFAGYEIFKLGTDTKFNDLGLYIKIEYGRGDFSGPAFAFSVGTATDGAGNLTGVVSTRREFFTSTSGSTGTVRATTGDGRFCVVPHVWSEGRTNASGNFLFVVERLRDDTGALTGDGFYVLMLGPDNPSYWAFCEVVTPSNNVSLTSAIASWPRNASGISGDDTYLASIFPVVKHKALAAISSALFYYQTDFTTGTTFSVSRFGTNRTYLPLGQIRGDTTYWPNSNFGHNNVGIAIQWE